MSLDSIRHLTKNISKTTRSVIEVVKPVLQKRILPKLDNNITKINITAKIESLKQNDAELLEK